MQPTYIYGRYKLHGRDDMEEDFFPIVFQKKKNYKSPIVSSFPSVEIPIAFEEISN